MPVVPSPKLHVYVLDVQAAVNVTASGDLPVIRVDYTPQPACAIDGSARATNAATAMRRTNDSH